MIQSMPTEMVLDQSEESGTPAVSDSTVSEESSLCLDGAHAVEQAVQRELLSHCGLRFNSLMIHRIPNGVCLKGVVEVDDHSPDICRVAQRVAGVARVLNHLVVQRHRRLPAKG